MRKISNQHESPYLFEKLKSIKDLEKQEFNQEWIRKLHSLKLEDIQKENINYSEIIYQNQFDCAVEVIKNMLSWFTDLNENEHTSRNRHGLISAEPQVGKTGLTAAIYNIMNVTGLLGYWDIKYIWLITGMDDCGLRKQNKNRLKSQFIGANDENIDWGENG